MIIYLLCGPRNCSTALMYSFNQRPDTTVIDEPFYGIRLKQLGRKQPFFNEIIRTMECDGSNKIHDDIEEKEKINGNVFAKNMANTFKHMNKTRVLNYRPVFLIRDPAETIISYAKVDASVTAENMCLEGQMELYNWIKKITKEDPIVIDGNELRRDPLSILTQLCNRLDLPFTEEMLSWPAGPKPIDGAWAPAWYKDVHLSTGFQAPSGTKRGRHDIPTNLVKLYDAILPYYQQLHTYSICA
jgi:hypothetical protein